MLLLQAHHVQASSKIIILNYLKILLRTYVCKGVTDGIAQLNLQLPVPVIFGVLTVDNQQQADERTGGIHGNKGEEAAITCLKMISLQNSL